MTDPNQQSLVRYGSFTEDALDQDSRAVDELAGGQFESIEVGDNIFRFLPPQFGKSSPMRVTAMHYVDAMPGLEKMVVFACPRIELKQPCPVCQMSERLMRNMTPADRERAQRLQPTLRVYANVINRKKPAAGVRVLAFGKQIFDQLRAIRRNPRLGGDYTDPMETGFDIIITRTGTGKNDTKYTVAADRQSSPLAPTVQQIQALIDGQHDLDMQVQAVVPQEILAALREASMREMQPTAATSAPGRVGAALMQGGAPRQDAQVVEATGSSSALDDATAVDDDDFN